MAEISAPLFSSFPNAVDSRMTGRRRMMTRFYKSKETPCVATLS